MLKMSTGDWTTVIKGIAVMLVENTLLPRWSDEIKDHAYSEDEKQCLNAMICWFLAGLFEKNGGKVDYSLFPKISILRGFEKSVKKDIKEEVFEKIYKKCPQMEREIEKYVDNRIKELTTEEFRSIFSGIRSTEEWHIYKAATAIATKIELMELSGRIILSADDRGKKEKTQNGRLMKYINLPGFENIAFGDSPLFGLFQNFSKLRNQVRWVGRSCLVKFNDLGHSWHVACLSYVTLLANGKTEEEATKGFFVGLFHDLAERWTGDFPSPIKDAISVTLPDGTVIKLRDLIDEIELEMLKDHVYSIFSEENGLTFLKEPFIGIMLEELGEKEKKMYKEGDRLSAVIEAYTNLKCDKYFVGVCEKSQTEAWSMSVDNFLKEFLELDKLA